MPSCCNLNAVPIINSGIIGMSILKKYFVITLRAADIANVHLFFRTPPMNPAIIPDSRAISFDKSFGILILNNGFRTIPA
jgi:hypothetical protein